MKNWVECSPVERGFHALSRPQPNPLIHHAQPTSAQHESRGRFQDGRIEALDSCRKVADAAGLAAATLEAFEDLEACRVRGEIGREALEAHRGSVEQTQRMIEEVLARRVERTD